MEDIRNHLAEIQGHDSNWTKQVGVYEQDLGMIEKHLLQQDDSFEMEMQQIQTWIEESGKKPELLLVDMKKLENTILSMLETLKERDSRRQKWMDIENQSLNRRMDQQHSWLSTKKKAFKEMDRERHNEFMKSKGRLLDENIEAVQLLNKARKALKENNKRVTEDITRLKGDLQELGMEEKRCINGWRKELKNYLEAASKHQRQEEDRKESEKFQKNKESCQQSKRNVRFCEPERRDVDPYLAFDKNCDKFANQLSKLDLYLHDIPGDGNCLFRALGDQLEGHQENHFKHRCDVVEYMVKHRDTFEPFVEDGIPFNRYISWLRKKGTHAGNDAIVAFAKLHHLNVAIHQLSQPILMIHGVEDSTIAGELHIAYHNGEHYSSVRRIDAKTTLHHKDRLASRHTEGNRCSQYNDQSSHQMGKPRSQMNIEKQHKDSWRKTETSWSRSNNQADVPKLSKGQETHQEVKKTIHKHVPGSVPRDKNSLGQETLRIKLRDENSHRQETQKGVLKDGKSLRHEALKDTHVTNPTSSMNIEDRTFDANDHYTSSMTMKEFSDYFNSQDMTVMEFVETKEFFDYSVSNSMTSFHLVKELKKGQRTQAKKQIKVESTTQSGAVDSKKPKVMHEEKLDTQLGRKSDILKRNSQDCGQNKVTQSNRKPIIADDGKSSVSSKGSAEVHKITADDGKSSADIHRSFQVYNPKMDGSHSSFIKDGKVQVTGSPSVVRLDTRHMEMEGKLPLLEVKDKRRNGLDPEARYSLQVYSGKKYSSGVPTEKPRGLQFAIQERDTFTLSGMYDVYCSKEYGANEMTKLDEQSDLGHLDHLPVGEVTGSAHLDSKYKSIHKSEPRIIKSVCVEESPHVKIGSGYQVTYLQTVGNQQDNCILDCKVKDNQVYLPPHRRSDRDWQEHVKKGFKGLQRNANSKVHLRSAEYSDHQKGQLEQMIRSANDLVKTKDKHTASFPKDIPGKIEAHTHSRGSLRNSTQSVEIQVNMEFQKPVLKDASVQCEQMVRPSGLDSSTSTDDFEDYLQSQQENSLSHKPLEESELGKSVTHIMCDTQPDADLGCCTNSASLTSSDISDQLEHGQPTSSSTPVKDADELVHNMDSGIHASDGEADSFNELMSMHDPMLSSSQLAILNPETVIQDINSLFQTRNRNSLGSHGIPNIQCTLEEVSMDQCLAASLVWGRILFNMELLRSQRCKDPLKGSGLV